MERQTYIKTHGKYLFVYIIFLVGIIGHAVEQTFATWVLITPYTLFIMGTYVLYHTVKKNRSRILFWIAGTYIVTFTLEAVGVHTGLIFGGYIYGDVLEPSLIGVPLIIGYNWVFVILGAACITHRYISHPVLFAVFTGVLAVFFDFLLEPVAINLGYWSWESGDIPLQNYAAWFVISFAAAYLLKRLDIGFYTPVAIHYFIAQGMFFIAMNVIL